VTIRKPTSSVLTGATWYLLEKTIRLVGAFLIGAWAARYLGPESYGTLAYALALVALLGFFGSWGIESLVVRDLVQNNLEQRRIISTYFFVRLVGSLFVPLLAIGYIEVTNADDRLLLVIVLIISGSVILSAFDAADCWLQAKQNARATSSIRMIGFLIGTLFKCYLIISKSSVIWFAFAVLVEAGVIAVLYFRLLWRQAITPSINYFSFFEFKRTLLDGKMMALSALMVGIYGKIDILVLGSLISKEMVAPYAIAASMCSAWNMVGMSVVQAWAPRVSLAKKSSEDHYISVLRKMIMFMIGLSVVGSILLSALSSIIFDFLLGEEFAEGSLIFNVLIWSSIFVFAGVATSQIIVNEKIYWISFVRTLSGALFSLIFIIPVGSNYGVIGIASLVVVSSAVATCSIVFSASARISLWKMISSFKD
jgi:O-antigen/teichoic acid export membrane protein